MRVLVTGAAGFLGSRFATLLAERGHDVLATTRPGGRTGPPGVEAVAIDAGDEAIEELVAGREVVLHFAGVPDPTKANADPARAVRENAGTTLTLLEACVRHDSGLLYPSTIRAALDSPPDAYAISKRLGEEVCRLHRARATVLRLTSVFGRGQVAGAGATGAIARFAACALEGAPIVIPGDPERGRDFVFADDLVPVVERIVVKGRWGGTVTLARGETTPLRRAAELVLAAAGSAVPVELPGGELPPGENETYPAEPTPGLGFEPRPVEEGIRLYVDWLRAHTAPQGRPRA
ncbi:MAG: NAD(P)-dependent oxidoreductase [Actinobacteria bacterium]|nr:NAD(P)-dependent oxidoreductase [Actinomycetota bacterium]